TASLETFPAGSVTMTLTSSPSSRPGFATDHLPSGPAVVSAVVPSGNVTETLEPGSAVPVIGSVALIGLIIAASGAVVSLVFLLPESSCTAAIATPRPAASPAPINQGEIAAPATVSPAKGAILLKGI